jgi:Holliday junction resolvasome RuvABC ATP-dependent DNA helicase subunit
MEWFEMSKELELAFERGLKGQVSSFDLWLREHGFAPERMRFDSLFDFLVNQAPINQHRAFDEIGEFLGYFSKTKSGNFHIVVSGVHGSGKTYLTSILKTFLIQKRQLNSKVLNARSFGEVDGDEQIFHQIMDELEEKRYDVLLIDDCHLDKNIKYSLQQISAKVKDALILTTWEPVFWDYVDDEIESTVPSNKIVVLKPFSLAETVKLLRQVVAFLSEGKAEISNDVFGEIHAHSVGVPGISIMLLFDVLRRVFDEGLENIDVKIVSNVVKARGIGGIGERMKALNDVQLAILRQIILSQDKRGVRPTQFAQTLNRDKATVSYYLSQLCEQGFLDYTKFGKFVYYQIPESLVPFVEFRLCMMESDFLA